MPAWSCPSRPAPRTSPATQGQAKSCLHVQRSDAAFQGGPQRVRVCSCVPRTQIKCALGRGGQRRGEGGVRRTPSLSARESLCLLPAVGPGGRLPSGGSRVTLTPPRSVSPGLGPPCTAHHRSSTPLCLSFLSAARVRRGRRKPRRGGWLGTGERKALHGGVSLVSGSSVFGASPLHRKRPEKAPSERLQITGWSLKSPSALEAFSNCFRILPPPLPTALLCQQKPGGFHSPFLLPFLCGDGSVR